MNASSSASKEPAVAFDGLSSRLPLPFALGSEPGLDLRAVAPSSLLRSAAGPVGAFAGGAPPRDPPRRAIREVLPSLLNRSSPPAAPRIDVVSRIGANVMEIGSPFALAPSYSCLARLASDTSRYTTMAEPVDLPDRSYWVRAELSFWRKTFRTQNSP